MTINVGDTVTWRRAGSPSESLDPIGVAGCTSHHLDLVAELLLGPAKGRLCRGQLGLGGPGPLAALSADLDLLTYPVEFGIGRQPVEPEVHAKSDMLQIDACTFGQRPARAF